jgi:tetratricopeptide (TPR) repeat protein
VDEAIRSFQRAASVRPHPGIFHGLGLAWMRKAELADKAGDREATRRSVLAAREALETALALGERQPQAAGGWDPGKTHVLLGQVLLSLGERQGARAHFEMGLRFEREGVVAETARRFLNQLDAR